MPTRVYYGKAVSASNYVNNGATVVGAGNVPSGAPVSNVPTTAQVLGAHSGKNGSVVAQDNANVGTATVDSNGTWATMTAGTYVMRRVSTTLAGVSHTILKSGGNSAGAHHSIHKRQAWRTTPISAFALFTGTATKGTATSDNFIMNVTGDDDAATPTRAVPGELCYMVTGAAATTDEYAARTQW
jgi:hypothetical protein